MIDDTTRTRIAKTVPLLDERQRRLYLGIEALGLGHGGITALGELTGASRSTITIGMREAAALEEEAKARPSQAGPERVRAEGGGRKGIKETNPGILEALGALVGDATYGDPENPLCWTTKSLRNLADELGRGGFSISYVKVGHLLGELGYSMQQNQKALQVGEQHVDRDAQFGYINDKARAFMEEGQPVISVDAKKKELVGNFANKGGEYLPSGQPALVLDHDFPLLSLGKATPYGIYDMREDEGYVSVGICGDTAAFAVQSIRSWWGEMGSDRYRNAGKLYVTCDGGGRQRQQEPSVEAVTAAAVQRDRAGDPRLAPAARDLEVEQDRAPDVQPHQQELAWQALGITCGDHQPDRGDDHQVPAGPERV